MAETRSDKILQELRKFVVMRDFKGVDDVAFTCDGCARAPVCEFAFDAYNTNGDCLEMK